MGVSKNWLPNFLGSTQYRSYYQPETVTTTRYLVELMGNSEGFTWYISCNSSVFTLLPVVITQ